MSSGDSVTHVYTFVGVWNDYDIQVTLYDSDTGDPQVLVQSTDPDLDAGDAADYMSWLRYAGHAIVDPALVPPPF